MTTDLIQREPFTPCDAEYWETALEVERDINQLARNINCWAVEKGFYPPGEEFNFPEKLMLIVSELSECMEAHRRQIADVPIADEHLARYSAIEVELADTVIRILDLCGASGFNIGGALIEKMAFNCKRAHKHGKRY